MMPMIWKTIPTATNISDRFSALPLANLWFDAHVLAAHGTYGACAGLAVQKAAPDSCSADP